MLASVYGLFMRWFIFIPYSDLMLASVYGLINRWFMFIPYSDLMLASVYGLFKRWFIFIPCSDLMLIMFIRYYDRRQVFNECSLAYEHTRVEIGRSEYKSKFYFPPCKILIDFLRKLQHQESFKINFKINNFHFQIWYWTKL